MSPTIRTLVLPLAAPNLEPPVVNTGVSNRQE
jgi:hypothetical protein